jgi:hypothetical protein
MASRLKHLRNAALPRTSSTPATLARTSDELREVAERVWYSVLKES